MSELATVVTAVLAGVLSGLGVCLWELHWKRRRMLADMRDMRRQVDEYLQRQAQLELRMDEFRWRIEQFEKRMDQLEYRQRLEFLDLPKEWREDFYNFAKQMASTSRN